MKKGKNIFWGVLFVLGAVALVVGQFGYLEGFGFWSILFSVGLIGFLVEGIFHRSFGRILFSLAFLIILYDKPLGLEAITPWPVLGAALLGSIGLNIIFPKHTRWRKYVHRDWNGKGEGITEEYADGEQVHFESAFGEAVKYVTGRELSLATVESSFGKLTVYLNNAGLKNGAANIRVDCSFGSIVLYVPSEWKVHLNVKTAFGGVTETGQCSLSSENCLQIVGEVSFGALEVRYI